MLRKKRPHTGLSVIIITSTIVVNILGVSYASWSNSLGVLTKVETGNLLPVMDSSLSVQNLKGNGTLTPSLIDQSTLTITGQVYSGYSAYLNFTVGNAGSLPLKFVAAQDNTDTGTQVQLANPLDPEKLVPLNHPLTVGMHVQLTHPVDNLQPGETFPWGINNPKLLIQADKEGKYSFQTELSYQ